MVKKLGESYYLGLKPIHGSLCVVGKYESVVLNWDKSYPWEAVRL